MSTADSEPHCATVGGTQAPHLTLEETNDPGGEQVTPRGVQQGGHRAQVRVGASLPTPVTSRTCQLFPDLTHRYPTAISGKSFCRNPTTRPDGLRPPSPTCPALPGCQHQWEMKKVTVAGAVPVFSISLRQWVLIFEENRQCWGCGVPPGYQELQLPHGGRNAAQGLSQGSQGAGTSIP